MNTELIVFEETKALFEFTSSFEEFQKKLSQKILDLLLHDFSTLVNVLYKIDINEQKARTCFGKPNEEIAQCLTLLIIERQTQKIAFRQKYKSI